MDQVSATFAAEGPEGNRFKQSSSKASWFQRPSQRKALKVQDHRCALREDREFQRDGAPASHMDRGALAETRERCRPGPPRRFRFGGDGGVGMRTPPVRKPDLGTLRAQTQTAFSADTFSLDVELITPLLGGGVIPKVVDEVCWLRASEVKAGLRFWWRALFGHR